MSHGYAGDGTPARALDVQVRRRKILRGVVNGYHRAT